MVVSRFDSAADGRDDFWLEAFVAMNIGGLKIDIQKQPMHVNLTNRPNDNKHSEGYYNRRPQSSGPYVLVGDSRLVFPVDGKQCATRNVQRSRHLI
jgi:hypothetical protein